MFFVIQKEKNNINSLDMENNIVLDLLKNSLIHKYTFMSLEDFYFKEVDENGNLLGKFLLGTDNFPNYLSDAIPIGTLEFVSTFLNIFHQISNLNPIEIPSILRTDEFLKRKYKIVEAKDLPREGNWFIKDVSKLKSFSTNGYGFQYLDLDKILKTPKEIETIKNKKSNYNSLLLDNTHLYQVSEKVEVLSEYRVYFINGKIINVSHYNGNPCLFPDISLIDKANLLYSTQKDYPKSYSLDVMITNRGTSIIEIHPFACVGLYSNLWGSSLLYAYRDGIDYYINWNTKLEKDNN